MQEWFCSNFQEKTCLSTETSVPKRKKNELERTKDNLWGNPKKRWLLVEFFFCCPLILNPWFFRRTLIFIVSLSLLWIEKRGNLWLKHNMLFLLRPYFLSASRNARILVVCIEGAFHLLSSVNHFFHDKRLQKKTHFFSNRHAWSSSKTNSPHNSCVESPGEWFWNRGIYTFIRRNIFGEKTLPRRQL